MISVVHAARSARSLWVNISPGGTENTELLQKSSYALCHRDLRAHCPVVIFRAGAIRVQQRLLPGGYGRFDGRRGGRLDFRCTAAGRQEY